MKISEMRAAVVAFKRQYRDFVARVGDDMGCDGTGQEAEERLAEIRGLEADIAEAQRLGPAAWAALCAARVVREQELLDAQW
jgi:hypothetical protein